MTVSSSTDRATFPGNGVATAFSLPFRFFANSDVVVKAINEVTGIATTLTLGIDYLLTGAGEPEEAGAATGVVTTTVPVPVGVNLFIQRIIPATQPTDIVNQGRFFPEVHETVFDRLTMLVQQGQGALDRTLRVQDFDPVPDRLPSAVQRANRILSFDADGNPVAVDAASDSSLVLRQDLGNATDPAKGAGIVGFSESTAYTAGTVGDSLKKAIYGTHENVLYYGAVADGVTDDSAAFNAARAAAAASGKFVYAPAGTYKLNAAITGGSDLRLVGDGDSTVLDFTGAITGADYALEAVGTATQIQELSGTQLVGDKAVLFASAPSLQVGDVFVIFNPTTFSWSGFRPSYYAGEWCEVESIVGNLVYLKNELYDTYLAANVDVYKITGPQVLLRDFKIKGTTITGLVRTALCLNPLIENLTAEHANDSAIYLDRCWMPVVNNPKIKNVGDGGDDYGIAVGNSQHARINGGSVYSRRHAITHGGSNDICSVTVRDSRVNGTLLRNDVLSGTEAADFHGNTEDSSYINCTIYGGANLQGKDNHYDGCTITNGQAGYCLYHAEVKGGRLGAKNCTLKSHVNPQAGGRGIQDIGSQNNAVTASTTLQCTFFLTNCDIYARNWTSSSFVTRFRNAGCVQAVNFEIDTVSINTNAVGIVLFTGQDSGTASSTRIIVDNLKGFPAGTLLHNPTGGHYLNFPHRMQRQSGRLPLTAASGTAVTISPTPTTFNYGYPREPEAFVTVIGDIVSNRYAIASLFALTASTIRPQIHTGDNVNWTGTAARIVSWTAGMNEA